MAGPLAGRDLAWLERRRAELFGLLAQVGDFRRGALNAVWRKCGKPNCVCARPGHRGHGPQWNLTRRVGGKTVNTHLRPGPELEKAQREVAEHQRFVGLVEEVTAVSEAICAARPVGRPGGGTPSGGGGKGGLLTGLGEIIAAEVSTLAALAAGLLGAGAGLGVLEQAMRAALAAAGARLLEAVLHDDDGYAGPHAKCGNGHQAGYAGCRPKTVTTVLGPVRVTRAWYHCGECGHGFAPRDEQLGTAGTALSPGLAQMIARAGAEVPFGKAAALLADLAGVTVTAKTAERSAEASGAAARRPAPRRPPRSAPARSARCPRPPRSRTCCMWRLCRAGDYAEQAGAGGALPRSGGRRLMWSA